MNYRRGPDGRAVILGGTLLTSWPSRRLKPVSRRAPPRAGSRPSSPPSSIVACCTSRTLADSAMPTSRWPYRRLITTVTVIRRLTFAAAIPAGAMRC